MKTTIELPDPLFREAKSTAAQRGIPLRMLIEEAVTEKLHSSAAKDQPWMKSFGKLKRLHKETVRINQIIEQEFGQLEPEDTL